MTFLTHEYFIKQALVEARQALNVGEVPIGAIVVGNNKIIAKAHNLTETLQDCTAHAEMLAITAAMNNIGAKYLNDCTLYVTLEPCVMCAGALLWSRISRVVYGAADPKRGYSKISGIILSPKTEIVTGVLENECGELIRDFFKNKRNK
jgi:tRNA(adenine34) deaminase